MVSPLLLGWGRTAWSCRGRSARSRRRRRSRQWRRARWGSDRGRGRGSSWSCG